MMSKIAVLQMLAVLCLAVLPSGVMGQGVSLVANLQSAECEGHIQDITLTAATCDYDDYRCTYGSSVYLTGQVTMTADIPRPLEIHVKRTMPGFYSLGWSAYDAQVDDICESGNLSPPSGEDAGYYCPQAGKYNFHFMYDLFGERNAWYAMWSGFSMGVAVHFKHEGGGSDYGMCHLTYKLKKHDGDFYTSVSFAGFALLGTGLAAGYAIRKRRQQQVEGEEEGSRKEQEMVTGFQLAGDMVSV
mmetsp:Transcript_18538/g.44714  ORF Transcript_18538/g.44714 Transcript_18538/m.44714 type:complete len:244 (-) Transcript_18538:204-935(-)